MTIKISAHAYGRCFTKGDSCKDKPIRKPTANGKEKQKCWTDNHEYFEMVDLGFPQTTM